MIIINPESHRYMDGLFHPVWFIFAKMKPIVQMVCLFCTKNIEEDYSL